MNSGSCSQRNLIPSFRLKLLTVATLTALSAGTASVATIHVTDSGHSGPSSDGSTYFTLYEDEVAVEERAKEAEEKEKLSAKPETKLEPAKPIKYRGQELTKEESEYVRKNKIQIWPIHEIWHALDRVGSMEMSSRLGVYSIKLYELLKAPNSVYLKELQLLKSIGEKAKKEDKNQEIADFFGYPFKYRCEANGKFVLPLAPTEAFAELMSLYMSSEKAQDTIRENAPKTFKFIEDTIHAVSSIPRTRRKQIGRVRSKVPGLLSQVLEGAGRTTAGAARSVFVESRENSDAEVGNERLAPSRESGQSERHERAEVAKKPEVSDAEDRAGRNGDYSGNRRESDGLSRRDEVGDVLPHTPTSGRSGDSVQLKNRESPSGERAELRRAESESSPDHRLSSGLSAKAARLKLGWCTKSGLVKPVR